MKWLPGMLVLSVLGGFTACSSPPPRTVPAPVKEVDVQSARVASRAEKTPQESGIEVLAYREPTRPEARTDNAVIGLVDAAEQQRKKGDYRGAAATLERALRIEPRNPHLWNRLAHVRLDQGRFAMAGDLAAKSNALGGDNPGLERDNWLIISAARRKGGDSAGARAAKRQADALR